MEKKLKSKIKEFVNEKADEFSAFAETILEGNSEEIAWEVVRISYEEQKGSLKQDLITNLGFEISRRAGSSFDY